MMTKMRRPGVAASGMTMLALVRAPARAGTLGYPAQSVRDILNGRVPMPPTFFAGR